MKKFMMDSNELLIKMKSSPLIGFEELNSTPLTCGVYTAWLYGESRCLYVGKTTKLIERIQSHFAGRRGGDQFCLYIYDEFIHELRCNKKRKLTTYEVNKLTGEWIQSRIKFKWIVLDENEINDAELILRKQLLPVLNLLR